MIRIAVAGLVLVLAAPGWAGAQSLYRDGAAAASLFVDHRARSVNDIVTILVVEQSSSMRTASTSTEKDDTRTASVNEFPTMFDSAAKVFVKPLVKNWLGYKSPSDFAQEDLRLDMQTKAEHEGKGAIQRSDRVSGQLPARVVKVLDNGNMVIEGRRAVLVNDETQEFTLSGMIRPQDVTSGNTVLSSQIADAEIQLVGRGILSEAQRPGIIYRFLDWLRLF
jgi:flagellar L-ring protein precursor FlgH